MKVINNGSNSFIHTIGDKTYKLGIGGVADVPKEVAKIWLQYEGVKEHAEVKDLEEANKKIKELEKQVKKTNKKA